MQNIRFLTKKDKNITLSLQDDEKVELLVIDTLKSNVDLNINITLLKNCNFNLVISSLNQKNFSKTYNVKVYHNDDGSISNCEVFGLNKESSKTHFYLEAIIKGTSKDNDCNQKIRGVLLSDSSEIHGKPNLIIDTNNIKAKHALAIGKLNDNQLFYLQNKGIEKSLAIKLLLLSYFNIILYKIQDLEQREKLVKKIFKEIGEID